VRDDGGELNFSQVFSAVGARPGAPYLNQPERHVSGRFAAGHSVGDARAPCATTKFSPRFSHW
jgi:hypothetical protein